VSLRNSQKSEVVNTKWFGKYDKKIAIVFSFYQKIKSIGCRKQRYALYFWSQNYHQINNGRSCLIYDVKQLKTILFINKQTFIFGK